MPELCNICLKTNQLILLRAYSGNSVINMKTKVSKHTLFYIPYSLKIEEPSGTTKKDGSAMAPPTPLLMRPLHWVLLHMFLKISICWKN